MLKIERQMSKGDRSRLKKWRGDQAALRPRAEKGGRETASRRGQRPSAREQSRLGRGSSRKDECDAKATSAVGARAQMLACLQLRYTDTPSQAEGSSFPGSIRAPDWTDWTEPGQGRAGEREAPKMQNAKCIEETPTGTLRRRWHCLCRRRTNGAGQPHRAQRYSTTDDERQQCFDTLV